MGSFERMDAQFQLQESVRPPRRFRGWLGRLARLAQGNPEGEDSVSADPQSSDEPDWDRRLSEYLEERLSQLEEARAPVKGAAVNYGAANFPHDPDVWLPDYRDVLPEDDPRRNMGPPIVRNGTPEAYHKMKAVSNALRDAYGLTPESDDDPHVESVPRKDR